MDGSLSFLSLARVRTGAFKLPTLYGDRWWKGPSNYLLNLMGVKRTKRLQRELKREIRDEFHLKIRSQILVKI